MKQQKTNAMRLLDKAGIHYETTSYDYDPDDLSAVKAARELGLGPSDLYKTLVLRGEPGGIFLCLVPGDGELDLKKAARASGNKKAQMAPMKELLALTGYIRGGCTPIGMKKDYPVYIDRECLRREYIYISAGIRGRQIRIAPGDLVRFTGAQTVGLVV